MIYYNGKTLGQINPPTVGGYIPQTTFQAGRRKVVVGGLTATVSGPYSIHTGMESINGCGYPYQNQKTYRIG